MCTKLCILYHSLKVGICNQQMTKLSYYMKGSAALFYALYIQFEKALELILSTATFPVEDIQSGSGEPCLLVTCPTIQVAVKLFQHTVKTLGKIDADSAITILVRQGIEDQQVSNYTCIIVCQC